MATSVVIRGSFREMVYSKIDTRCRTTLMKGRIGRYLFEIVNFCGNYPTAYIHLPKDYPIDNIIDHRYDDDFFMCLYDRISLPVHQGLTWNSWSESKKHGVVLGWDYGHEGDWHGQHEEYYLRGIMREGESYDLPKRWTVGEILGEIRIAVSYLERERKKAK